MLPGILSGDGSDSGSESGSSSGGGSVDWKDRFPFEENLFRLSHYYEFAGRIATNKDAVIYRAIDRQTGHAVAIKVRDVWNESKDPKEVRILTVLQGHECFPTLHCWFPLPSTETHAIVTGLLRMDDVSLAQYEQAAVCGPPSCDLEGLSFCGPSVWHFLVSSGT